MLGGRRRKKVEPRLTMTETGETVDTITAATTTITPIATTPSHQDPRTYDLPLAPILLPRLLPSSPLKSLSSPDTVISNQTMLHLRSLAPPPPSPAHPLPPPPPPPLLPPHCQGSRAMARVRRKMKNSQSDLHYHHLTLPHPSSAGVARLGPPLLTRTNPPP